MTLLIDLAIRSSVILAAGLVLSMLLSRRSAALRHRVLTATLIAAALVIPCRLLLPEWTILLPALQSSSPGPVVTNAPGAAADTVVAAAAAATPAPVPPAAIIQPAAAAWFAGFLVAAGALSVGLVRVSRVAARAVPIADRAWLQMLESVAARYGLTRTIRVSRTDATDLLATWGVARPQVLVPVHAVNWTLDRIHVVFSHELAHIRRHDWIVQLAAEVLCAILWFNPLAWIACKRLRRESEQACDDEVLRVGVGGREYAGHLLDLARLCRQPPHRWASALPMAHPSTLERRITAMLNPRIDRSTPSRRVLAVLGIGCLLAAVPAASVRARVASQAQLTGTIYDASGAVVPGVRLTLMDENEASVTATTNASGQFQFGAVAPGKYTVEAGLPGFRTLRQQFELRDPRDWTRAITLQVGELSETISVSASRVPGASPTPTSATPQRVRVGGNIRAPRKIVDVRPTYPDAMREAGLTGVVPIEAVIGRDGTVWSVRVLSAQVHPDFAIAAIDAVRQWRFTPTLLNGVAVDVVMTVTVRFDLD